MDQAPEFGRILRCFHRRLPGLHINPGHRRFAGHDVPEASLMLHRTQPGAPPHAEPAPHLGRVLVPQLHRAVHGGVALS